ncbi:hypothetical protein B7Y94_03485 [Candidatus Saccharibacteria bacterium 32-49-12]|nr:MAG: hypothetical protein B7Y94_03485 [Candidatus Saccharibacteria bacterium 32-49-12]
MNRSFDYMAQSTQGLLKDWAELSNFLLILTKWFVTYWEMFLTFGLIIFIVWIWSMVSTIVMNSRIQEFLDTYGDRLGDDNLDDIRRVGQASDEETDEGAIDKDDNYTHSEPQRISALKLTQTMKNVHLKTTYMVMAASIPILLIVLIIVALIF